MAGSGCSSYLQFGRGKSTDPAPAGHKLQEDEMASGGLLVEQVLGLHAGLGLHDAALQIHIATIAAVEVLVIGRCSNWQKKRYSTNKNINGT